jgi:hypothetical protein
MLSKARSVVLAATLAAALTAGCSGGDDVTPEERLRTAKQALDSASSVHVVLSTARVPESASGVLGGEGWLARPSKFKGQLRVSARGLNVTVETISVDGQVWAQLPLTSSFTKIDPKDFGVSDPAALFDPDTGVSRLLTAGQNPKRQEATRLGREVLDEIAVTLQPEAITGVLPATVQGDVDAVFGISEESGQLRRAVLTGPFYDAATESTLTIVVDRYGEKVDITPPAG